MITLDQAKKLKKDDCVIVSATRQQWFVDHVAMQGVLPFVHVWRGTDPGNPSRSVIPPERLHLFELDTLAETKTEVVLTNEDATKLVEHLKAEDELIEKLEAVPAVEVVNSDIKFSEERLETKFVEEPPLTKPARKSRSKAK